uniref:Lipoprotein n=1 Tax=Candidatus Kentrum sp. LFY TaxID=2126342 RepID=A0A450UG92_9GAMM|nr:MAG: hypothetical protein BECKLFY1418B_GA0070995_102614 [Candidatus Kentron sp. LFY]
MKLNQPKRKNAMISRYLSLAILLGLTSGCASWIASPESKLAHSGPGTIIEQERIEKYADQQTQVLVQLRTMAGETSNPPNWDKIISAGLQYSDVRCSDYLEALYSINKQLKADVRDVNATGTFATGLMGIAKSAASEVAAVAVLFGYAEETIGNSGSRMLFELEPSALRSLVEGSQKAFRGALPTGYDRAGAFSVIREYAVLCLPSTIEAEINNAAKNAKPRAASGDSTKGEPPKVSVNENQVRIVSAATREQAALKERIGDLMTKIDSLQDSQAKTLSMMMPGKDDREISAVVSARDSGNLRFTDGNTAKSIAKMVLVLTAKSESLLDEWEIVLKQF